MARSKQRLAPRRAKVVGLLGFAAAVALPVVVWRDAIAALASGYHPSPGYFIAAWTPFCLIGLGLLLMVPVVYSIGLSSYAPASLTDDRLDFRCGGDEVAPIRMQLSVAAEEPAAG